MSKKLAIVVTFVVFLVRGSLSAAHAAEFVCPSGNVNCLIDAINEANEMPGEHIINLAPGNYTLQAVDNATDGVNGLPSITGSILIRASSENPPTVIERDPAALGFRIFHISADGELSLEGVIVQRGNTGDNLAGGIFNRGLTWLRDSIVRNIRGEEGAIYNIGTLNVFRSTISENIINHGGGGIYNVVGGNALVEDSTFFSNTSTGGGGILNHGSLVVRNSSFVFNMSDGASAGGGILNFGTAEIVNSTIARNNNGVANGPGGHLSIINSTIRENHGGDPGAGISNFNATLRLQNTIIAGNTRGSLDETAVDCFGTILSDGNNLIGDPTGCTIDLQQSDLTGDPGLGALVGLGQEDPPGRVFYPVLSGSVIINRANAAACPQTDQLRNPRFGICDIGAIEFQYGSIRVAFDNSPRDFDGDRKNDIGVYRDGVWFILRSSDGGVTTTGWGGLPQDIPVPGDYDGDGKTDVAVYRDGVWFVIRSSGGVITIRWGGLPQDIPVPADYDGDGKTDMAVYRDGVWFILRSSDGGVTTTGWGGLPQDIPVPGDYDGDGKTDVAVYRDGVWFVILSSGGVITIRWGGLPQDIPVPADYDGDGKTDITVYQGGLWFILRSSDLGVTTAEWGGVPDDVLVPGDYDGDGKADIAVYRDGIWFILRSFSGAVTTTGWGGLAQDIPLNRRD